ncbi:MAG: NADH-quinone oxidoreductase subunit N [Gemmataceae bacterium]
MDSFFEPSTVATLRGAFAQVVPEAVLLAFACVMFLGGTIRAGRSLWASVALIGLAAAGIALALKPGDTAGLVPSVSTVWPDALTQLIRVVSFVGMAILILITWGEVPDAHAAEYHASLLLIAAGVSLTAAANELITLFLALELVSIPTYVVLYLPRSDRVAQEAAIKYFLLSVFSSGFALFGFSYLYGLTGTTNLAAMHETLTGGDAGNLPGLALMAAAVMVLVGLGFRVTAVPFHFYAPDVYQGTSTGNAALLAFVPKVAGFIAMIRLLGYAGPVALRYDQTVGFQIQILLWMLAAITMTLGNVVALWQDNLQRILAYSSVAHAGYMLIGLTVAPPLLRIGESNVGGVPAVVFYLLAYGAMTLGAFGVLSLLNSGGKRVERVDDLGGLSASHPSLALLMSLFLFSLIGLPLTAGFAGKFFLFFGAFLAPGHSLGEREGQFYVGLALIGAINAAIGAYYYLRIIGAMFLRPPVTPPGPATLLPGRLAVWACAVTTLVLGVYPAPVLDLVRKATTPVALAATDVIPKK